MELWGGGEKMRELINIICDIIRLYAKITGLDFVATLNVVIINLQNVFEIVKKKEKEV